MLLSEANGFVGIDLINIGAILISECGLLVCGHRFFIDSQPRQTTCQHLFKVVELREDAKLWICVT